MSGLIQMTQDPIEITDPFPADSFSMFERPTTTDSSQDPSILESQLRDKKQSQLADLKLKLATLASNHQIEFIYLMNDKVKYKGKQAKEANEDLEEGELDEFELELTQSKQKNIDACKVIFDQCSSKQYDYILNKRLT